MMWGVVNESERKEMKYLFIYFYFTQVCAPVGSSFSPPPYYYMGVFDTFEEAKEREKKLGNEGHGVIIYGVPDFLGNKTKSYVDRVIRNAVEQTADPNAQTDRQARE